MTVFKRGEVYWTEFVYKGQRIRQSTGTDKLKLANAFEEKLRRELHEQVMLGRTKAMTFGEATDHYVATNINVRRKTPDGKMRSGTKDDLGRIKRMEEFFGTDTPLSAVVAPAKIAEYRTHLLRTGIKPNSANRILNIFRAILNAAFKAGGLAREPLVESFASNDARERFLSAEEEKRLLKACPSYLRNLVTFYLDTGARHDEGIKLTWSRVRLVDGGRSSVTFTDTKNGKTRTVPLPDRSAALLKRLCPKDTKKQPRVFLWTPPGEKKKAVPFDDPKKAWETARTAAKLDGLRIHDLRHTYASKLIKRRVPLYEVSKLMGHSSIRMTERYAHLVQEQLETAVATLD